MKVLLQFTLSALMMVALHSQARAQCTNTEAFGSVTLNTMGTLTTISSCSYDGEYSTISGTTSGQTLTFTSTTPSGTITVRSGSPGGAVVAFGSSPLNFVNTFTGTLYAHWNLPSCGTASTCRTTTVQCISCLPPPPPAPANDNCAGAISLSVSSTTTCTTSVSGTVAGATQSLPSCTSFGTANDDVWYSFVATATAHIVTVVGPSGFDAVLEVRSGACNGTSIDCRDATASGGTEVSSLTGLTIGNTYLIRIHNYGSGTPSNPTFTVCVTTPPPPLTCPGALGAGTVNISTLPYSATGLTNCGNGNNITSGNAVVCGNSSYYGGEDKTFIFTPTSSGTHNIIFTTTSTYSGLVLYAGCPFSGTCVTQSQSSTGNKTLTPTLTAGVTYYLVVDSWPAPSCHPTFDLTINPPLPPPANDDCANAISLPVSSGPTCGMATNGTTAGATQSLAGCFGTANDDVWYSFVATNTEHNVTVVGATSFDAVLNVRSGACNGTSLVCVDNTGSGGTEVANLTGLTIGTTYLVRVYHWFSSVSSTPTFTICVTTPVPPCSAPSTPMVNSVGTTSASLSWGAVSGATLYRYSSGSGFHTCGSGSQTTAGTSVNLTGLAPNTTYTFCVRTDACGGGAASSYVSTTFTTNPLPNDNCSGAINISCGQTVSGSTVGATSDAAIGSCTLGSFGTPGSGTAVGGTPGLGVWYRLMGDGSQVSASLCNSSYDTKIHIYEGSCGTLTCVASNDDNSAQCSPGSRSYVQFNTNPGSTYYILVSGFSSSTGNFSLQIGCVCGAPLGFPWTTTAVGGASGESIDNVCGGSIDISSNGYSTATSDNMMLSSQQICGDASITVRVANITNQGYAGITMRESTAPGSKHASLSTQLANRVFREARSFTNGPTQKQQLFRPAHSWLRIVRTGNTFTYFSSSNGSQWGFVGTSTIAMPNCLEVGMFTTGLTQTLVATAVFTDVDMTGNQQITMDDGNPAQFKAEIPLNDELSIFPNPSSGEVNLRLGQDWIGQPMEITIFNSVGKVVMNENIDQVNFDTHSMSLDRVASGIYFLQVKGENGMSKTERIVINK